MIVLDADSKTLVIHVAIQKQEKIAMDPNRKLRLSLKLKPRLRFLFFIKLPLRSW